MNIAFLIGRIIVGGYFISAGVNHFKNLNDMSEFAKSKGTPAPKAAVAGTGILLLLGGLSMLLGVLPLVGVILLIIFLLGVSFQIHAFWKVSDPQARAMEMIYFMKNIALIGALLMFLAIPTPWPLSW
jgi:putative oxidoreductase